MKKIIILAALVAANLWTYAQMTPEAIMGAVPTMPTSAQMLDYYRVDNNPNGNGAPSDNVITTYLEAWEEARNNIQENNPTGDIIKKRAMSSKVGGGINKTADQVKNMSDAEAQAMAMAAMNKKMAGLGLSQADMAKLQSGNLSEAEQQALVDKIMAAKTGGINTRDIQAMQNMSSDEERMDYMQMTGLAESGSKKIKENQPKLAANQHRADLLMEGQKIDLQMKELTDKIQDKKKEAREAGIKLYKQKYEQQYAQLEAAARKEITGPCGWEKYRDEDKPKVLASCERLEAVLKQQYDLMCRFYSEYIPMWRDAVTDGMDMARSQLMPLAQRREKIGKELYEIGHEAEYATYEIFPFTAANTYFELSRDVVDFKLDFSEVQ